MAESQWAGRASRGQRVRRPRAGGLLGVLALLLSCVGVTAGAAQAGQQGAAAGRGWRVQPTPNPAGATISELSAVSCTSGRACTAVGSRAASLSSLTFTLAERWNGTRWRIQRSVLPRGASSGTLFGVSCPSATSCTAVGSAFRPAEKRTVNLAEAWNGTRWRVQAIPNPKGAANSSLHGVSCTSRRACTAVGTYETPGGQVLAVAERWNGTRWALQAIARPAAATSTALFSVSCTTAHACTAAGHYRGTGNAKPLAEAWNGRKWRAQPVPLPHGIGGGILAAVSCISPRTCTATGASFSGPRPTLAERWNGTRWRVQPTPNPADFRTSRRLPELNGISCASATACIATVAYAPGGHPAYFLQAWNGRSWRLVAAPKPLGFKAGALNGLSCTPAWCSAVGAWSGGRIPVATLAMGRRSQ